MPKSKLLTREMLESYGITNITEDGHIFVGDKEKKQSISTKKGKYKLQQPYARVTFSDKSKKVYCTNKKGQSYWTYSAFTVLVNRAIYAWYHGEVPAGYEVDHIDNNTLNNHLHNLRLLTKEENLNRKPISRNQHNYWKTDEEILAERENKKYIYDRDLHRPVKTEWWMQQKEQKAAKKLEARVQDLLLKNLWHSLNAKIREKQAERSAVDKTVDMAKWRKLGIELDLLKLSLAETKKKLRK